MAFIVGDITNGVSVEILHPVNTRLDIMAIINIKAYFLFLISHRPDIIALHSLPVPYY